MLTLDEAISHAKEKAEELQKEAIEAEVPNDCLECARSVARRVESIQGSL